MDITPINQLTPLSRALFKAKWKIYLNMSKHWLPMRDRPEWINVNDKLKNFTTNVATGFVGLDEGFVVFEHYDDAVLWLLG